MAARRVTPLVFLGVLMLAAFARAKLPRSPDSTSRAQFLKDRRAYMVRTMVGAYERVGSHDPSWDEQAKRVIRGAAKRWSPIDGEPRPGRRKLRKLGRSLMKQGCDDPMLRYCTIEMRRWHKGDTKSLDRYVKDMASAASDLKKRGYPADCGYWVWDSIWVNLRDVDDPAYQKRAKHARERMLTWLTDALKDRSFKGVSPRVVLWRLERCGLARADDLPAQRAMRWLDDMFKQKLLSPWLYHTISGWLHDRMAWNARGDGFASTVTDNGWKTFHAQLEIAKAHLVKAWAADQRFAEPAVRMIAVAMGLSDQPRKRMRTWFERAVGAQFDNTDAYRKYRWGLRARWHGGPTDLIKLGFECARTRRFDTPVPYELIRCLMDAADDADERVFPRYHVYPHVKAVLEGYRRAGKEDVSKYDLRTLQIGFASWCGRYDEVVRLHRQLDGEPMDVKALKALNLTPSRVLPEAAAKTSQWAGAIRAATAMARSGRMEAALAAMQNIAAKKLEPEPVRRYVADRVKALQWRLAFDRGKTIDLLKGGTMDGLIPVSGKWSIDDRGRLVGQSTGVGQLHAVLMARLGNRWELSGQVATLGHHYGYSFPGVVLAHRDRRSHDAILTFVQNKNVVNVRKLYEDGKDYPAPTVKKRSTNRFDVINDAGVLTVKIDGKTIIDHQRAPCGEPMARLGVGGHIWWKGDTIAFNHLRLSKPGLRPATQPTRPPRTGPPKAPR